MATSNGTHYQRLESRPGSNYRQLFLRGRRIRAAIVYEGFRRIARRWDVVMRPFLA